MGLIKVMLPEIDLRGIGPEGSLFVEIDPPPRDGSAAGERSGVEARGTGPVVRDWLTYLVLP
jgi:hypothetical protein